MAKIKVTITTLDGEVLDYLTLYDERPDTREYVNNLSNSVVNIIEENYEFETNY